MTLKRNNSVINAYMCSMKNMALAYQAAWREIMAAALACISAAAWRNENQYQRHQAMKSERNQRRGGNRSGEK